MSKTRILLAEDDLHLGTLIQDALLLEGYDVVLCTSGTDALQKFAADTFHLCVLDVMMPKMDGYTLARNIRKTHLDVPIFFLTAKSQTQDKIEGFRAGGDDYLTKPFNTEEFILRVQALTRRRTDSETDQLTHSGPGKYQFKPERMVLVAPNGEIRKLTKKENEVLRILYEQKGKVVERELLLTRVWGANNYFNGRSLDVYITKLRKHLNYDPGIRITNVHGVGFMLED